MKMYILISELEYVPQSQQTPLTPHVPTLLAKISNHFTLYHTVVTYFPPSVLRSTTDSLKQPVRYLLPDVMVFVSVLLFQTKPFSSSPPVALHDGVYCPQIFPNAYIQCY